MAINEKSRAGEVLESVRSAAVSAEAKGDEREIGRNPDGQDGEAHQELTLEEVERLTDETVDLLLKTGGGEAQEWIEKGRIIHGYVERLQPNGKFSKPNPFTKLSEREDIPWAASQLRTYRDAYLLWQRMGGTDGVPKVDVTTVGLVLSLDADDAQKILRRAAKEKLTTRQVGALVKKTKGTGSAGNTERVTGDWKVLGKAGDRLNAELSLMIECPAPGPTEGAVVHRLEVVLKAIEELLEKVNTPGWGAQ